MDQCSDRTEQSEHLVGTANSLMGRVYLSLFLLFLLIRRRKEGEGGEREEGRGKREERGPACGRGTSCETSRNSWNTGLHMKDQRTRCSFEDCTQREQHTAHHTRSFNEGGRNMQTNEPVEPVPRRQRVPLKRPPTTPREQERALAIWRFDHDLIEYPSQELH